MSPFQGFGVVGSGVPETSSFAEATERQVRRVAILYRLLRRLKKECRKRHGEFNTPPACGHLPLKRGRATHIKNQSAKSKMTE
jgi:hypothetical protein